MWYEKSGNPDGGWVFPNTFGLKPNQHPRLCRRRAQACDWFGQMEIALCLPPWRGQQILTQLTGNPIAASQLLRHKNISVTMTAYIKADRTALATGMKMLETKLSSKEE